MKVSIRDSRFRPGGSASSKSEQKHIQWVDHMTKNVIITDRDLLCNSLYSTSCVYHAWLLEPYCIDPDPYEYILNDSHMYHSVFGHDIDRLGHLDNFIYIPTCMVHIDKKHWVISDKTKSVSACFSGKSQTIGHKLRHKIYENIKEGIDFYGSITGKYLADKSESIVEYKYHIVVENSNVEGYYTEKLIDCILTGSIPIYWGSRHTPFHEGGMLRFCTVYDLMRIIRTLPDHKLDEKFIKLNYEIALSHTCPEKFIRDELSMIHLQ